MVEAISQGAINNALERFKQHKATPTQAPINGNKMDLPKYLNRYGVGVVKVKQHGSSVLHCLERCIFDEGHVNSESAIGQTADGKLFYQCFHNSCKNRTWHDAKQIISGNDSLADFYPINRSYMPETKNNSQSPCNQSVNLVCAADIKPEPVSWVWDGYIAKGKVHILAGPAGHGKTTVLLALAATITIAGRWPDGTLAEAGDVVPIGAISEEGTSGHYPIGGIPPVADKELNGIMENAFNKAGLTFFKGDVWTTDAPYRETAEKVEFYQKKGILAVEMEMSALMTLALYRGVRMGGILIVSDELFSMKWHAGFSNPGLRTSTRSAGRLLVGLAASQNG